jgi:FAD/FMN-containing dehydrogenase
VHTLSRRQLLRTGSAAALGLGLGIGRRTSSSAWTTATPGPTPTPVDPRALEQLRQDLTGHGQVLLPSDVGFADASAPNNGRYLATRPAAVAVVEDETGVVTCVNWCRNNNVTPVARGGGHSYGGFSTVDNGLVVNIGKLNSVDVASQPGAAVVGGAALNENLFAKTVNGRYFLPGGTCPKVGVGGLVLGGGIGYNTRSYGLTCDHLTATRIVTADGQVRTASADENQDLFWACRGGAGGSFGINTSFTFQLEQVPIQKVSYYRFDYPAGAAADVFGTFHEILQVNRPELNAVAWAQSVPNQDGNSVVSRGQFIGNSNLLKFLVQPLLDLKPQKQELMEYDFWTLWQQKLTTPVAAPHSYGDISRFAKTAISSDVIAKLVDLLAKCPSRTETANGSIYSLGWVGGSIVNKYARTDTAYVHRGAMTLLRPTTIWPNNAEGSVAQELNDWTSRVIAAIGTGPYESYQNFPNRDIPDWLNAYYAENLPRLVQIKAAVDPNNLFKNPQSIPTQLTG